MAKVKDGAVVAYVDSQSGFGPLEAGYYVMEGEVSVDSNGVAHESSHSPGDRVYPVGDGAYDSSPPADADQNGGE